MCFIFLLSMYNNCKFINSKKFNSTMHLPLNTSDVDASKVSVGEEKEYLHVMLLLSSEYSRPDIVRMSDLGGTRDYCKDTTIIYPVLCCRKSFLSNEEIVVSLSFKFYDLSDQSRQEIYSAKLNS